MRKCGNILFRPNIVRESHVSCKVSYTLFMCFSLMQIEKNCRDDRENASPEFELLEATKLHFVC